MRTNHNTVLIPACHCEALSAEAIQVRIQAGVPGTGAGLDRHALVPRARDDEEQGELHRSIP